MFKFLIEFGPLAAFLIGYKVGNIFTATVYMLVATVAGLVISLIFSRKINKVMLISSVLVVASASLTIFSGNSIFIKMKPTLLYCIFAGIFFASLYKGKLTIKYVLENTISLKEEKNWRVLNIRFMLFFIFMAIINELVWRFFEESTWVSFKIFGVIPITLLFVLLQVPYIMKHKEINSEDTVNNG